MPCPNKGMVNTTLLDSRNNLYPIFSGFNFLAHRQALVILLKNSPTNHETPAEAIHQYSRQGVMHITPATRSDFGKAYI